MVSHDQDVRDYVDLTELLARLETMLREDAFTDRFTKRTTSQAQKPHADGLRILAAHGRFRIVAERGPVVVAGYWPEHDPQRKDGR